MDCHQILSGACNSDDQSFAVGSVEGVSFTVRFFFYFKKKMIFLSRILSYSNIIE